MVAIVPPPDLNELDLLRRQLARQDMVLEITRLLSSEIHRGVDYLLPLVADKACFALNADRTTMYLVDPIKQELWTKVTSELEIKEIRIPVGAGMAGLVAKTGEVVTIGDCYTDPRWSSGPGPSIDRQTGYKTSTMLVMPMRDTEGQILGVFQVINKLQEDGTIAGYDAVSWPTFNDDDVEFLGSIASSAAIAIQNAQLVDQVKDMFSSTVQTLATTLDRRNPSTAGHSQRVSQTAVILAKRMGLSTSEVEKIRLSGLLHDIGKMGIRDEVLTKPAALNDEEFRAMRMHAQFTREILDEVVFLRGYEDIPIIAAQHHEKLDGTGYPFGQKGDEITIGGRLLAVADTYDALREKRVYKDPFSVDKSVAILREEVERGHLDGVAVTLMEECIGEVEATCGPLRPGWEAVPAAAGT